MRETWYVMEDGSAGNPREISAGADGRLVHKDGRKVAYAPHGPRSRGVDVANARDMRPGRPGPGYLTREAGAEGGEPAADSDLAAARAEYHRVIGKRAYAGWDAAVLREKIAAHSAGDEAASDAKGEAETDPAK